LAGALWIETRKEESRMQVIAFYILSTIVVLSALFVIAARNPVHSVLWLILAFFTSAGLLVLIGAEFLAMLLVVVYVGAVAVLFLFVVMMLDIDFVELKQGFLSYVPGAGLIALALLAEIGVVAAAANFGGSETFKANPGAPTNAEALSNVLYTDYLLLFQMSGIVLLVAMMGAIVLTLRHRPNVKRQNIAKQTSRKRKDAVELKDVRPGQGL
jgi:NADH-quinone oxidoreductase subunit J